MINKTNMAILIVSAVIGVTTFVLTRPSQGEPTTGVAPREDRPIVVDDRPRWGRVDAMSRWLGLTETQRAEIDKQDPTFLRDIVKQREQLAMERDRLAQLFENPAATDQQITGQVERLIGVGNETERRVTRHLLAVRKHLTLAQQKQLFGLCAAGVRGRMGGFGRGGGGGRGGGFGRGGGGGRGQGFGGQGRGRRGRPSTAQCCPHDQGQGAPRGDCSDHETSRDWSTPGGEAAGPSSGFDDQRRGRGYGRDGRGQGQGRGGRYRQQSRNR